MDDPTATFSYPLADTLRQMSEIDPDHPAIVGGSTVITYRELLDRCARWSRPLRELGRDDRIVAPVHGLDPWGASMLIASVLAGVRVCPLDADDPPHRIERLCTALGAVRIDPDTFETIETMETRRVAGSDEPDLPHGSPESGRHDVAPRIVTFTSGSTNEPKALEVPTARWNQRADVFDDELDDQRCRLMVASPGTYGFVVGVLDSILLGATTVMYDLRRGTARGLLDTIRAHAVSFVSLTPTLARELARLDTDPNGPVRLVELRGERSTGDDLRAIHDVFPAAEVRHLYGAIESTRIATWRWRPGDPIPDGTLPAGSVERGVEVRLVEGELWTRSSDAIDGYLLAPADAAAKFVRDGDSTWVRTGDRVTIDDGMLHVHGRVDRLRKVGGLYVDLDDVARHLAAIDAVGLVEVTSHDDGHGTRLVAHVVARSGAVADLDPMGLRAELATHLPLHMIPSTIRLLDEMPLNASAKIDTRSLEAWRPLEVEPDDRSTTAALATPLGTSIRAFVEAQIGRRVMPDDDLLAAGLDSLGWIGLASHLEESTGTRLAFADIVRRPTANGIVATLQQVTGGAPPRRWVRLRSGERVRTVWLANGWAVSEAMDPARHTDGHDLIVVAGEPDDRGRGDDITVRALVNSTLRVVSETGPPDVVVGTSTTTYAAMATARVLASQGTPPRLLVLLDPPGLLPLLGVGFRDAVRHLRARLLIRRQATTSRWRSRPSKYAGLSALARHNHSFRRRRLALIRHRPRQYDGPTLVFTSSTTGRDGAGPNSFDRRLLTGAVRWEHLEVAHPLVPYQGAQIMAAVDDSLAALADHGSLRRPSSD